MSLHGIVRGSFGQLQVGPQLRLPRGLASPGRQVRSGALTTRLSIGSMRILEAGLAAGAIATAILIGHGQ